MKVNKYESSTSQLYVNPCSGVPFTQAVKDSYTIAYIFPGSSAVVPVKL